MRERHMPDTRQTDTDRGTFLRDLKQIMFEGGLGHDTPLEFLFDRIEARS